MYQTHQQTHGEWLHAASFARATRGMWTCRPDGVRPFHQRGDLGRPSLASPRTVRNETCTGRSDSLVSPQSTEITLGRVLRHPLEGKEAVFVLASHDATKARSDGSTGFILRSWRSWLTAPVGTGTVNRRRRSVDRSRLWGRTWRSTCAVSDGLVHRDPWRVA